MELEKSKLATFFRIARIQIANLTIGKTKSKTPKPKVPWWNQDIKKVIKDKNDALKKFQTTNNQEDFIKLKHLRAKSKYLIKLKKIAFLSPKQNGFRKNRSTMYSLYEINEEIKQTLENKQLMGVIKLDIAKAYDTSWKHYIIVKLNSILCQGRLLNTLADFTTNRKFQVKANNYLSCEFKQENGVPQGSALSVTLFIIAINDITQNCNPPVKYNLFADDFNYWCRSNNAHTVQNLL
ncbi:hypothetical protein QTP88_024599 [Uroleucon formosanum]